MKHRTAVTVLLACALTALLTVLIVGIYVLAFAVSYVNGEAKVNLEEYKQNQDQTTFIYAYDDKELDEAIKKVGKGYQIQRYKGLGEMSAEQLWDTTMNPATRNLIQVTVEDASAAKDMIEMLMGDKVEGRKQFLAENANFNKVDGFIEKVNFKREEGEAAD